MQKLLCDRLCDCQQGLSGADDEELFGQVLAHLSRDHPAMPFSEDRIREFVSLRAYNLEYAAVYTDGEGLDEEFGPDPYWTGPYVRRLQEKAAVGMKVRVREDHMISELRGTVGEVVGSYGGEELMVLGVHFPDGGYQLLWPGDLDDVGSPAEPWWRCLLGRRRS